MKKKILFIVGARPNIIKLAPLYKIFNKVKYNCKILHTNQHSNFHLYKKIFFDLGIKKIHFVIQRKNFSDNTGMIAYFICKIGVYLDRFNPDLVIVFGDVDTTFAASIASVKKLKKIIHIEAGLRSKIFYAQEEINRRIIDRISWLNFTSTVTAQKNMKREDLKKNCFLVGNIIFDNFFNLKKKILKNNILKSLKLKKNNYILITLHRYQTINHYKKIKKFLIDINTISINNKILFSVHSRTLENINKFKLQNYLKNKNIILSQPLKYTDFSTLLIHAKVIITDSGGVQEEAKFHSKKTLIFREKNEREDLIDNKISIRSENKNFLKNFYNLVNKKNIELKKKHQFVAKKIYNIIKKKINYI